MDGHYTQGAEYNALEKVVEKLDYTTPAFNRVPAHSSYMINFEIDTASIDTSSIIYKNSNRDGQWIYLGIDKLARELNMRITRSDGEIHIQGEYPGFVLILGVGAAGRKFLGQIEYSSLFKLKDSIPDIMRKIDEWFMDKKLYNPEGMKAVMQKWRDTTGQTAGPDGPMKHVKSFLTGRGKSRRRVVKKRRGKTLKKRRTYR
jgi:hypothetical protein